MFTTTIDTSWLNIHFLFLRINLNAVNIMLLLLLQQVTVKAVSM